MDTLKHIVGTCSDRHTHIDLLDITIVVLLAVIILGIAGKKLKKYLSK